MAHLSGVPGARQERQQIVIRPETSPPVRRTDHQWVAHEHNKWKYPRMNRHEGCHIKWHTI